MTYFDKIIADIDRFRDEQEDISLFEASLLVTVKKLCETGNLLEAENAALKKHCEWLEQNLNLKNTVVDDLRNQLRDALERC